MNALTFTQHASGTYRASITASPEDSNVTMHLNVEKPGYIKVLASIDDSLEPVCISVIGTPGNWVIKQINKPHGVVLTIETETPVIAGGYV